jgi:biotin operon repressor
MPAHRKHIPKETLQHLYLEQGLSPKAIGLQLGCGETAVRRRLKEYSIPMRSRSQAIRLGRGIVIEREPLVELYWRQSLSIPEVAARLDCSEDAIRSRMQEYDIPRRTPSESAQLSRGIDLPEELAREWYECQQLSIAAIAERLGCSETAVRNKLIQCGIERRTPWAHEAVDLGEDELRRLYEEEEWTVEAIAEAHGCSAATVSRKMHKYGIKARPPWRERYPRHDFSENPLEKAYLVGFRLGDLTVRRAELSIEVIMTTTRQEQVDLMHDLFDQYGHVYEHHRPEGKVFMQVRLNDSFSFLIPKEGHVPDWILADERCFFAFAAGYIDADGSIRTVSPRSARLDIQTYDQGILHGLWKGITNASIHCAHPRIVVQAGWTNNVGIVQRQDKWGIWVHRRKHLHQLLKRLLPHFQHDKRRKDALAALQATGRP